MGFYDIKPSQTKGFYPNSATEPDMRQELNNMFDGKWPEVAKKQPAVLRKMRVDSNDKLIPCACVDLVTGEPDIDTFCPTCFGEGFVWDERFIDVFKVVIGSEVGGATKEELIGPGLMNISLVIFYTRSSVDVTEKDKIVELVLDTEGGVVQPPRRRNIFRIVTAVDERSDNAKLEYWKLDCYEEQRKFLNGPAGV